MNKIMYSHRPIAGVSIGAFHDGRELFVAFAITNDGTSRNGRLWPSRQDKFSRTIARSIINGRIELLRGSHHVGVPLTRVFETDLTARQFVAEFRKTFKPTNDETDTFLDDVVQFPECEVRVRPSVSDIVNRLESLAEEVVANASASV